MTRALWDAYPCKETVCACDLVVMEEQIELAVEAH